MRLSIILFLVFISVADSFCQNRNSVWCFGHNAGINFNSTNPVADSSACVSRGSCATICNSNGDLIFYVTNDSDVFAFQRGRIYQSNHLIMQNGDSLIGRAWYQEHVIVPHPTDTNLFYTFSVGVTSIYGFYYSIVDMSQNGGLGAVTQKNIQLQTFRTADCITAIKHGNGRDWWVIFRSTASLPNNDFYEYLITPNGISNVQMFSAGSLNSAGFAKFCVNTEGNKIAFVNAAGLIEIYHFNRCDGMIDSVRTIEPELPSPLYPWYWECAFSPNGNLLYVTTSDSSCLLLQYNLSDSNPSLTRDTLQFTNYPIATLGAVRLAPDNRIYVANAYYNTVTMNYPYPDTMYNVYNTYLSVINHPDSVGTACDFQPYSFYLGGKRCYKGLPNNPDYDLPRLQGSSCDTIQWTGVQNIEQAKGLMYVSYISDWQKLFVNAQGLKGISFKISVYDMVGNVIYTEEGKLSSQYFTKDLNMAAFAKGMYIVNFVTDKERLAKKFIKD